MKLVVVFMLAALAMAGRYFPEDRVYSHELLSEKECEEFRKKFPVYNCHQTVSFYKDGTATVLLTDIMNPAKYEIEADKVTVTPVGPGEFRELIFKLASDEKELIEESGRKVWKRR